MKRIKSLFAAAVVALLSATLILPIAACNHDGNDIVEGKNAIYVISKGGMALQNVTVELTADGVSMGAKLTDEKGKVTYDLDETLEYGVTLTDIPVGFLPESNYTVKGWEATTYIRIDSKVITETPPYGFNYKIGDVAYDFEKTFYTFNSETNKVETKEHTKLSDFFEDGKKAVLIDFFYNDCTWCNRELPYVTAAYEKYSDKLEILGINDYDTASHPRETEAYVIEKVQEKKVPYLMCKDDGSLIGRNFSSFVAGAYPTAIMVDRYGIMCEVYSGGKMDQEFLEAWFEKYTSDNYEQTITPGEDPGESFVPDLPADFVRIPDSQELTAKVNPRINKTGKNIVFDADGSNSSYAWPWDLTADKTAIYPTNSGHRGTMATIYAQIYLEENEVLAFDYKLSSKPEEDYFFVSLDSRTGKGRQITAVSGVQGWQTGYAYAAQEYGSHEIEFSYLRTSSTVGSGIEDKVYINNLRIVTIAEMNAELAAKQETFEVPYFATRSYNNLTKQYQVIEDVYLAEDGYYHIGTEATAKGSDPYLLFDLTHSTPYFPKNSENIYTLINSTISTEDLNINSGVIYMNSKDYTDKFMSYLSFSGNSAYEGLIPVTQEIKDTIAELYDCLVPETSKSYSEKGWLQFCVYYKQYGVQKELTDPIKGLSYFSAFDAVETTGLNMPTFVEVEEGTGQFIQEDGKYVDVEGTDKAGEGNYNLNEKINKVHFENAIMPRGYMYKFVPTKTGVYSINGIDCYYFNKDESITDGEATDAELYDGKLDVSHAYAVTKQHNYLLASSDSDRYERNTVPQSFKIIYYLEAGKTYYINVAFRQVETTGDFAFRIDYLDNEYSYISQAASNYYTLDEGSGKMVLPLYCEPYYDEENDVWLDRKGGGKIFVDFTQFSAMLDEYTIADILDDDKKTSQFTFDISATEWTDAYGVTHDISLDLEKRYGDMNKVPDVLKEVLSKYEIADYTEVMKEYLAASMDGKDVTDPEYGLVPANDELYCILQLFNAKFFGYDEPNEWLKACCFRLNVNADNHG